MYNESTKRNTARYFGAVSNALSVILRPYKGRLDPRWLGIDTRASTVLLAFDKTQMAAVLTGRWLGEPVAIVDASVDDLVSQRFRHLRTGPSEEHFEVMVKLIAGAGKTQLALSHDYRVRITLDSPETALGFIGPLLIPNVGQNDARAFLTDEERRTRGLIPATPPWTFAFLSNVGGDRVLADLDEDPIITAHGVADVILTAAGLRSGPSGSRYAEALASLRRAINELSATNERALQDVIADRPWILVDETDYLSVMSEPVLDYEEVLSSDGTTANRRLIPDLLYDLHDDLSLVVELESYPKRLFVTHREAGYGVPSAATRNATFQILGYRHVINGPAGAQVRRILSRPDAWSFRYLLVVGSEEQGDFDRRSWESLRETMNAAGVEMRTWDHYIGRLERLRDAASFR